MNYELPVEKAEIQKGRGTKNQIANTCWIMEKARVFQRDIYFCFMDYLKSLIVGVTTKQGKYFMR